MGKRIKAVKAISVGTTATEVSIGFDSFMIFNNSANTVYMTADGATASAANGFPIAKGTMPDQVFTCEKLSLVASGASSDVRLLYID